MRKIPMIFPGQASQVVGMAADLVSRGGPGAEFLSRVDGILDLDLTATMFEGPADVLTETRNAQPAILAHSTAVALELREMGIEPAIAAGHSLGEYSAAVAVGALTPEDGLKLVRRRGELMFAAGREVPGTMAAIMGLSAEEVDVVCRRITEEDGVVVVANHNSAQQIAISGEVDAVDAACAALKDAGAKRAVRLNVSGAFHSPLLSEAADRFAVDLAGLEIAAPTAPIVANVSARAVESPDELSEGFRRQLVSPVLWHDGLDALIGPEGERPPFVLEVGPGKVLSNLAKRAYPDVAFLPVGTAEDLDTLLDKLAG